MTQVSTHLFYGLFATTSSLLIASEAFSKVKSSILAIDLIIQRTRQDGLQIQKLDTQDLCSIKMGITKLPVEIWEMIKLELIGIELVECEKKLVNHLLCEHCRNKCIRYGNCGYCEVNPRVEVIPTDWKSLWNHNCDLCWELHAHLMLLSQKEEDEIEKIESLLDFYNLHLVSREIIRNHEFDLNCLSPIGAAKQHTQMCEPDDDSTPFRAITSFSSTAFNLPSSPESISQHFKALAITFHLEFVDYKKKTEQTQMVVPTSKSKGRKFESMERKDEEVRSYEIPCWQLWTEGSITFY